MKLPKKNKFQPEVNPDTSIVIDGQLWDIGVRVKKWYEKGGYNGYSTKKVVTSYEDRKTGKTKKKVVKGKRYGGRWPNQNRKIAAIKQFLLHHTGGFLPGACFNTLHGQRGLSVQFINDDKGVIYQTMDCKEIAWHGGKQNRPSIGVENCLFPTFKGHPDAYRESKCKRLGLAAHEVGTCYIQGKMRKVFMMPDVQVESLAFLIAGTWIARDCIVSGQPKSAPKFPVNPLLDGIYDELPPHMDFNAAHRKHEGIVSHSNVSLKKWDPAGLDAPLLESKVEIIYKKMKEGINEFRNN